MAKHLCASCRRGDIYDVEADYEVSGWVKYDGEKKTPIHAFLCKDHLFILEEDYETELKTKEVK